MCAFGWPRTQIKQLFSARRVNGYWVLRFVARIMHTTDKAKRAHRRWVCCIFIQKINFDEKQLQCEWRITCKTEWKKTEHQVSLMRFVCAAACSGRRSNNEIRSINAKSAFARIRWPNRRRSVNIYLYCLRQSHTTANAVPNEQASDRQVPAVFDSLGSVVKYHSWDAHTRRCERAFFYSRKFISLGQRVSLKSWEKIE